MGGMFEVVCSRIGAQAFWACGFKLLFDLRITGCKGLVKGCRGPASNAWR